MIMYYYRRLLWWLGFKIPHPDEIPAFEYDKVALEQTERKTRGEE